MKTEMISICIAMGLNLLDIIVGIIQAVKNNCVSSTKLRDGMFKKVGFIFCYALAFIIDNFGSYIGLEFSFNILPILLAYVAITEITSIIENVSLINEDLANSTLLKIFNISHTDSTTPENYDESEDDLK